MQKLPQFDHEFASRRQIAEDAGEVSIFEIFVRTYQD